MTIGPIERLILERLNKKRMHSRSFHRAKGVVAGLVSRKLVKRVAVETLNKVYLEITPTGEQVLKEQADAK